MYVTVCDTIHFLIRGVYAYNRFSEPKLPWRDNVDPQTLFGECTRLHVCTNAGTDHVFAKVKNG